MSPKIKKAEPEAYDVAFNPISLQVELSLAGDGSAFNKGYGASKRNKSIASDF